MTYFIGIAACIFMMDGGILGLLKLDDVEGIVSVGISSHSLGVLPRVCVVNT